jgi:hypothetical protein
MPLLAAAPVTVSPEERAVLEGLVHAHSTPQQLSTRARLILQPICSARIPNQTIELVRRPHRVGLVVAKRDRARPHGEAARWGCPLMSERAEGGRAR